MVDQGKFHLYAGPMFSEKTQEMKLEIYRQNHRNAINYMLFRPKLDTRDKETRPGTLNFHLEETFIDEKKPSSALDLIDGRHNLVAFDEIMLFSKGIRRVIDTLLEKGVYVLGTGLDQDFRGEPFGQMGWLLSRASKVRKLTGICMYAGCDNDSYRTQRLINGEPASYNEPIVSIQGSDSVETYETRCIPHHIVPGKPGRR